MFYRTLHGPTANIHQPQERSASTPPSSHRGLELRRPELERRRRSNDVKNARDDGATSFLLVCCSLVQIMIRLVLLIQYSSSTHSFTHPLLIQYSSIYSSIYSSVTHPILCRLLIRLLIRLPIPLVEEVEIYSSDYSSVTHPITHPLLIHYSSVTHPLLIHFSSSSYNPSHCQYVWPPGTQRRHSPGQPDHF